MSALVRRQYILVSEQPSVGSYQQPDPINDGILCEELSLSFENSVVERPAMRYNSRTMSEQKCTTGRRATVSFKTEIKGSGTTAVIPEVDRLLRIAGFDAVNIPLVSTTYNPTGVSGLYASIELNLDGNRVRLIDCVVTAMTTEINSHQLEYDNWTITGRISTITPSVALAASVPYDSIKPVASFNRNFQYDSKLIYGLNSLVIDQGQEVDLSEDLNSSDGYNPGIIVSNDPSVTFSCLQRITNQIHDWDAYFNSNTKYALTSGSLGSTAGNRVTHQMPAVNVISADRQDQGKLLGYSITGQLSESNLNDYYTRVYT